MGYYTRIDLINVRVKKEHVEYVKSAIKGKIIETVDFQYMVKSLRLYKDRYLFWNEYPIGKWYRDQEFAEWLGRYVEGGFVALWGHEGNGDNWAYEFDGEGGLSACSGRRAAAIKGIRLKRGQRA